MIRFVCRFLGFFALAGAFVAVLYDGAKTIAADALSITPLELVWSHLHQASLERVQATVRSLAPPWVFDPVLITILAAPAALVLAVLGALLLLLGRKRKPPIGYAR